MGRGGSDVGAVERALEGILAMLERIVGGGQTGAGQAGWRAAQAFGVATGGWMPHGFLTEDGPRPELADRYGARELPTASYPERTFANARDSEACRKLSRSCLRVEEGFTRPSHIAEWIVAHQVRVLNVAGTRESRALGSGDRVERFLVDMLRRLGHGPI